MLVRVWRFVASLRLGVWCGLGLSFWLGVCSLVLVFQPGLEDLGGPPLKVWLEQYGGGLGVWWLWVLLGLGLVFGVNLVCCTVEGLARVVLSRRWWLLSPYVAHVGLVVLLGGLAVSAFSGFKLRGVELPLGEVVQVEAGGFGLRFVGGGDRLEVIRGDQVVASGALGVNQPLFYAGQGVYFAGRRRWIRGVRLEVESASGREEVLLFPGEVCELRPGLQLVLAELVPDFRLNAAGEVVSASEEYANPAVRLRLKENGRVVDERWLFVFFPDFARLRYADLVVRLRGAEWMDCLLVDVAYNPGARVALAGGVILVLGLGWNVAGKRDKRSYRDEILGG